MQALETVLLAPQAPQDVLLTVLSLAEFMEHADAPLPIDIRLLASVAEQCGANAKAVHYRELDYLRAPAANVEHLIALNNALELPEAAVGILRLAQQQRLLEAHGAVGASPLATPRGAAGA